MTELSTEALVVQIWSALDGDLDRLEQVTITGPERVLDGPFDVTGLAAATVAVATTAVAEFGARRQGVDMPAVVIDRLGAAAAFGSETLLRPVGWELPPIWDPIAGNYRTVDGWIRLHTNYSYHRAAALRALGLDPTRAVDRDQVTARARGFGVDELEQRVVAEGGCAAALNTAEEWAVHPHGRVARQEPAVRLSRVADPVVPPGSGDRIDRGRPGRAGRGPLTGVRVLDLTRVIAGPVATRTLAAWGADVLRIDPPGFAEVPALLPDVTAGKHCAALDLQVGPDRIRFEALLAQADVIVHGLRPGALAGLGYSDQVLRRINPRLTIAANCAYGWDGPWADRRGFDSLVQLSCGIAATAAAAVGSDRPGALPAQALDHGAGYLLAAAVVRALTDADAGLGPADIRTSLVGLANLLTRSLPILGPDEKPPTETDLATLGIVRETEWGPVAGIGPPGSIDGRRGSWPVPAGPLGRHAAAFAG